MSQEEYDDGVRLCPHCRQWKQFQLSGAYFHCEFCGHDLDMEEFEASRDPNKLPLVGRPVVEGQTGQAMGRKGNGEGMPKPDVHPIKDEWGDIPEGVPDGDPKNF